MKNFKDIVFSKNASGNLNGNHTFENGVILSVICGSGAYSNPRENKDTEKEFSSFEVAILNKDKEFITKQVIPTSVDDVLGWLGRKEIDVLMAILETQADIERLNSKRLFTDLTVRSSK